MAQAKILRGQIFWGIFKDVCQVREKSGYSVFPQQVREKSSQGKVWIFFRAADIRKYIKILVTFQNLEFQEDTYRGKSKNNVDGESGKTRKKLGKSQGILC